MARNWQHPAVLANHKIFVQPDGQVISEGHVDIHNSLRMNPVDFVLPAFKWINMTLATHIALRINLLAFGRDCWLLELNL